MQPTSSIAALRTKPEDMQNGHVVVLHGFDQNRPSIFVAGWTEDCPKEAQESAVLYEPIMFALAPESNPGPTGVNKITWFMPEHGLPAFAQFDFERSEVYEGVSPFGTVYLKAVLEARKLEPRYERAWAAPIKSNKPQQQGGRSL